MKWPTWAHREEPWPEAHGPSGRSALPRALVLDSSGLDTPGQGRHADWDRCQVCGVPVGMGPQDVQGRWGSSRPRPQP